MIKIENLVKIYKNGKCETKALDDVTLTINDGEMVAIMGDSGSGKSTLLNVIGCMDKFDNGTYFLDDIEVHKLKESKRHNVRKKYISMIFQNFALLNHNTVYENVEIPLIARGIGKKERKKLITEALEKLGIGEIADKLPIHISGGQQQRCAIARAIVSDCKIILADEPTGALDHDRGLEIMDILSKIPDKTVIVVTHNEEVAAMAERIIRIKDGKIV